MKAILQTVNVAAVLSRFIKVAALFLVAVFLFNVVEAKFDHLRSARDNLPEGYVTAADRTKQLECLARNIYWEAASEPFEGKVGVAQVTMNRVASGKFADSVCGVVYQKNVIYQKVICQFSWYCEGNHKMKAVNQPLWRESEEVAKKVLLEGFRLPSLEKAMYYHADYVNPAWNRTKIDKIGHHIFYK